MDKDAIHLWSLAADSFMIGNKEEAIESFQYLKQYSKANFNIGAIYQQLGMLAS